MAWSAGSEPDALFGDDGHAKLGAVGCGSRADAADLFGRHQGGAPSAM